MRKELIVKEDPKSPISEIFRTLRTNMQFMNNKKKLQSILITSTLPGEGKSWVSANLAVTFAQAGKKVILIDADMRKGRQYTIFGVSPKPGLSNYLSGFTEEDKEVDLADYVQETEVENLYVIPAGNIPPNPSELLISENMMDLLENLKVICDIIILDGPPTQLVTDSLILTRMVDSTIVVAASNQTKKDNLRRILDNIQKVGGKIAGVVINKIPVSYKEFQKSYYYGSTTMMASNRKNKNRDISSKNLSHIETRNRNTQRARELVNQNRKVATNIDEKKIENKTDPTSVYLANEENLKNNNLYVKIKKAEKLQNNELTLEKTNDILKQINEYLEKEKKNLE